MENSMLFGLMGVSTPDMVVAFAALMIPIVTVLAGIGMGAWAVYLSYKKRKEMFTLYHQERMAAIEKGIQLPPLPEEFFSDDSHRAPRRASHSKLLAGLILFFFGATVFIAMYFTGQGANSLWSLTLVGLGLAFLIFYVAVERKQAALPDVRSETPNQQNI